MANILLFGGFVQSLSCARSLKEVGHVVRVVACHDKIASHSNYIDSYTEIESMSDIRKVESFLVDFISKYKIDVLIPMEDSHATILSQLKSMLEEKTTAKVAVMDWDIFQLASNKSELLAFCKKHGFGHPRTALLNNDIMESASYVGFPALIKPSHSEGAKGIVLVNDIEELKSKLPTINKQYGECSLQEYINSKDYYYNLMLYRCKDGSFGNHTIIKILRYYPIKGGSSSLAVSIENPKMLEMCKKLLDKLNWVGFADFDILEKGDGDYKIIEINPRIPASIRGGAMSGVNFPKQIVDDLLLGTITRDIYHPGNYLRFLGLDIAWFLASPNRFRCQPSWFNIFGRNVYYEDGGIKDLPAMFMYFWQGIKKQLSSDFRKSKSGLN